MLKIRNPYVYYGSLTARSRVTCHFREGEIVTLIGANRAGKTTLLNAICGLVRWQVDSEEGLDILNIHLTLDEAVFSDEVKALEGLCRRARRHLEDHPGINARITLKEASS